MTTAQITRQFDDRGDEFFGPSEVDAVRREALDHFGKLGLPGRRVESWRYTDLTALTAKEFCYLAPKPDAGHIEQARSLLDQFELAAERSRCVFIDGHLVDELSQIDSASLFEVERADLQATHAVTESALGSLNTAFAASSTVVRVTGAAPAPLELFIIGTGQKLAPQLRLKIDLAADASATVIQQFIDLPAAGEAWLNLVTEINQQEGSSLELYRLQSHASEQYQTTLQQVRLAKGAKFSAGSIELGGAVVRNEFDIRLQGTEAHAQVFGLAVTSGQQHSDLRIAIDHQAANTTSQQDYRTIVDDASQCVFNGKVAVQEKAQHIEARQRNDNLLLSAKAEVDTKPELEIYADQVICSHGATVGELSEDHLFYLRARGIDEQTARGILTTAFANVILERFEIEDFLDRGRNAVQARLSGQVASA